MRELMEIMTALMKDPSNVVETNLHTTGYILINSGIEDLAAAVGAKVTTDSGPDGTRFLTAAFGGVELLQVSE